jgi:ubiquinone/menaquinone biosynthesis C-methylase UbiE
MLGLVPESPPSIADFSDVDASNVSALIDYLDAVWSIGAEDKRKTYAAQHLAAGMRVLDLGCGTGDDVRAIAEIVGPNGKVVGVDSSAAMVAEARKRGVPKNVDFVRASADALPFEAKTFDACRAERVFLHLRNPNDAACELRRVLRDGGSAFLLDPDWEALLIGGAGIDVTRRITRALANRFANPWAGRNAVPTLRRAGFHSAIATPVVSVQTLPAAHDLFLSSALDYAISSGAVTSEEASAWLRSLLEADRRREFFCGVVSVAALATA